MLNLLFDESYDALKDSTKILERAQVFKLKYEERIQKLDGELDALQIKYATLDSSIAHRLSMKIGNSWINFG